MIEKEVQELLSFIDGNPTAYHTTASVRNILLNAGFSELLESRRWQLEPGRSYFVCRNGSSIIAFRMGDQLENYSFNVAAAHTDSPCFRIKENAEIHMGQNYTKLNTEGYGGMICATWMDRPLSVAGRVLVQENGAIVSRLVALDRDLLMIPSVAIHMNREVNDKASFNKQVDMLPVLGGACEEGALKKLIAEELKVSEEQILGSDLFLYVREKATVWGCNEEFISCGRLDDQQCVYGILKGLLNRIRIFLHLPAVVGRSIIHQFQCDITHIGSFSGISRVIFPRKRARCNPCPARPLPPSSHPDRSHRYRR